MSLDEALIDQKFSSGSQRSPGKKAQSVVFTRPKSEVVPSIKGRRWTTGKIPDNVDALDDDAYMQSGLGRLIVGNDIADSALGAIHRRVSKDLARVVGEGQDGAAQEGENLQTNGEAMVNLLNNCLGSGLLAISFAISEAGIFVSLFLVVFAVLLNKYTLLLNIKTCRLGNCDPSTTMIAEKACGKTGRGMMVCMYTAVGFFCMVS
jgi:hypothetical protein